MSGMTGLHKLIVGKWTKRRSGGIELIEIVPTEVEVRFTGEVPRCNERVCLVPRPRFDGTIEYVVRSVKWTIHESGPSSATVIVARNVRSFGNLDEDAKGDMGEKP